MISSLRLGAAAGRAMAASSTQLARYGQPRVCIRAHNSCCTRRPVVYVSHLYRILYCRCGVKRWAAMYNRPAHAHARSCFTLGRVGPPLCRSYATKHQLFTSESVAEGTCLIMSRAALSCCGWISTVSGSLHQSLGFLAITPSPHVFSPSRLCVVVSYGKPTPAFACFLALLQTPRVPPVTSA